MQLEFQSLSRVADHSAPFTPLLVMTTYMFQSLSRVADHSAARCRLPSRRPIKFQSLSRVADHSAAGVGRHVEHEDLRFNPSVGLPIIRPRIKLLIASS